MTVSIIDDKLEADLFCKPTDCHQFLYFNSAHPFHNKKWIVYSQGLCIKRLCSSPLTFQKHIENLKTWFYKGRYPQKVVDVQIERVPEKSLDELFERPDRKKSRCTSCCNISPSFSCLRDRTLSMWEGGPEGFYGVHKEF